MRVAGIFLAAGTGAGERRIPASQAAHAQNETSPAAAALAEFGLGGLSPVVTVIRAGDELKWLSGPLPGGIRTETSLTAHLGLSFSLRCGLNAVLPSEPDAVLVAVADGPLVTADLIGRLMNAFTASPGLDYAASRNGHKAMPPSLFARSAFPALQQLDCRLGAEGIFNSPDFKGVMVEPEGIRRIE